MLSRSDIYRQAIRYFDSIQAESASKLMDRRKKLYLAVPEIEAIDNEISMVGIKTAQAAMKSPDEAKEAAIALKERLDGLNMKKRELMAKAGFPRDYLKPVYKCDKCRDTGFIDGRQCSCFTQKIVEMAYDGSNMREITKYENFDSFNINFYSENQMAGENMSPRENMQRILAVCLEFTKNFSKKTCNLMFYGPSGLGKTFLCSCIARELLDKGYTVLYATSPQLFKAIEKERFSRTDENEDRRTINDDIQAVDLLIIDDLGTELNTSFTSSELFDILNTRLIASKPVIISTNLLFEEIQERYSERITSRIMGDYKPLKFYGEDIRIMKSFGGFIK